MKKFFAFAMLFAAAASAFVSCTKDVDTDQPKQPSIELSGRMRTISLGAAMTETRTTLSDEYTLQWAEGDKYGIYCVNDDGYVIDYVVAEVNGGEAQTISIPEETYYICAVYPENTGLATIEGMQWGRIPMDVPRYVEGDFSKFNGRNLKMAAKATLPEIEEYDDDIDEPGEEPEPVILQFSPAMSVLEFNIYSSEEDITGTIYSLDVTVKHRYDFGCAGPYWLDFYTSGDYYNVAPSTEYIDGRNVPQTFPKLSAVFSPEIDVVYDKNAGKRAYVYLNKAIFNALDVELLVYKDMDDYEGKTYKFSYDYSIDLLNYFGYTVNIDLAKANAGEGGDIEESDPNPYKWDFTSEEWQNVFAELLERSKSVTATDPSDEYTTTVDGLTVYDMGHSLKDNGSNDCLVGGTVDKDADNYGGTTKKGDTFFKLPSGGQDGSQQYFSFTAPISGELILKVGGTSSDEKNDGRGIYIQVGDFYTEFIKCDWLTTTDNVHLRYSYGEDGKYYNEYGASIYYPLCASAEIKIWSSKGHRIYSIEYVCDKFEGTTFDFTDTDMWSKVMSELEVRSALIAEEKEAGTSVGYSNVKDFDYQSEHKDFFIFACGSSVDDSGNEQKASDLKFASATNGDTTLQLSASGNEFEQQGIELMVSSPGDLTLTVSTTGTTNDENNPNFGKPNKLDGRVMKVWIGYFNPPAYDDDDIIIIDDEDYEPITWEKHELKCVSEDDPEELTIHIEPKAYLPSIVLIGSSMGHKLHSIAYTGRVGYNNFYYSTAAKLNMEYKLQTAHKSLLKAQMK